MRFNKPALAAPRRFATSFCLGVTSFATDVCIWKVAEYFAQPAKVATAIIVITATQCKTPFDLEQPQTVAFLA